MATETPKKPATISVELKADGLSAENVTRLDAAIKRTLLMELATLNVPQTGRVNLKNPFGPLPLGRTWGIVWESIDEKAVNRSPTHDED